jgi:hypothetical protein
MHSMDSRLRIIVSGLVALCPVGGFAWDNLQYVIGLAQLGHDVWYHEDTWSWPYHPFERRFTSDSTYSARFIQEFFRSHAPDLAERWHYRHLHETSFGMDQSAFDEVARSADLFLNVSGACFIPDRLASSCVKVFLDTDPGYNQIVFSERFPWSENVDRWCTSVEAHDRHFTYAENIHGADCIIPKLGFDWKTTRMPLVREVWEPLAAVQPPQAAAWSTVMTWSAFKGKLVYQGIDYQSKGRQFEELIDLPRRTSVPLKVAVGGIDAPVERLARHGWQVVDAPSVTVTPGQYKSYIAMSRGEVSPAKHVYVALRSGWFSTRSACYLGAGRPVVVEETGFSSALPVGEGIMPFTTVDEAGAAIQEVEANYARHTQGARAIAREYFDSDKLLTRLIEEAME